MQTRRKKELGTRGYIAIGGGVFLLVLVAFLVVNGDARARVLTSVIDFFVGIYESVRDWVEGLDKKRERFEKSVSSLEPALSGGARAGPAVLDSAVT